MTERGSWFFRYSCFSSQTAQMIMATSLRLEDRLDGALNFCTEGTECAASERE